MRVVIIYAGVEVCSICKIAYCYFYSTCQLAAASSAFVVSKSITRTLQEVYNSGVFFENLLL